MTLTYYLFRKYIPISMLDIHMEERRAKPLDSQDRSLINSLRACVFVTRRPRAWGKVGKHPPGRKMAIQIDPKLRLGWIRTQP